MSNEQGLGVTEPKQYSTGKWYTEVIQEVGPANYGPEGMSGFIAAHPRGYVLWGSIQNYLDGEFKKTSIQSTYFSSFILENCLKHEKNIVEGFGPEAKWVTRGDHGELEERLAVHLTSKSIITPYMAQQACNHHDPPFRTSQRASVVHWGTTKTKPFLRTREFLWQEGHAARKTRDDVWDETMTYLSQCQSPYGGVFAIPVLRDTRLGHDRSPDADMATTVEALMPDDKSMQAGTSHYFGTPFAETFDLTCMTRDKDEGPAYTISQGLLQRSLDAPIMTHPDGRGLVLPPTIAPE